MFARALLTCLCVLLPSITEACKPVHWSYGGGAKTSAEYAETLFKHADAIVVAKVVASGMVRLSQSRVYSRADLNVLEYVKGSRTVRELYNLGINCPVPRYTPEEERLFVLVGPSEKGTFSEVSAWQHPDFPIEELLNEFRRLAQLNRTVETDARNSGARRSP